MARGAPTVDDQTTIVEEFRRLARRTTDVLVLPVARLKAETGMTLDNPKSECAHALEDLAARDFHFFPFPAKGDLANPEPGGPAYVIAAKVDTVAATLAALDNGGLARMPHEFPFGSKPDLFDFLGQTARNVHKSQCVYHKTKFGTVAFPMRRPRRHRNVWTYHCDVIQPPGSAPMSMDTLIALAEAEVERHKLIYGEKVEAVPHTRSALHRTTNIFELHVSAAANSLSDELPGFEFGGPDKYEAPPAGTVWTRRAGNTNPSYGVFEYRIYLDQFTPWVAKWEASA